VSFVLFSLFKFLFSYIFVVIISNLSQPTAWIPDNTGKMSQSQTVTMAEATANEPFFADYKAGSFTRPCSILCQLSSRVYMYTYPMLTSIIGTVSNRSP